MEPMACVSDLGGEDTVDLTPPPGGDCDLVPPPRMSGGAALGLRLAGWLWGPLGDGRPPRPLPLTLRPGAPLFQVFIPWLLLPGMPTLPPKAALPTPWEEPGTPTLPPRRPGTLWTAPKLELWPLLALRLRFEV